MSRRGLSSSLLVVLPLLLVLALIAGAGLLGLWLGGLSAPFDEDGDEATAEQGTRPDEPPSLRKVPLCFSVDAPVGTDLRAVAAQAGMAAEAGIHNHIVPTRLSWPDSQQDPDAALRVASVVREADPAARFIVRVDLNPPPSWLSAHPEAAVQAGGRPAQMPCLASEEWIDAAKSALDGLFEHLEKENYDVVGCMLTCLEDGCWRRADEFDTGETNTAAFRQWLTLRYSDDAALQGAWGTGDVTIKSARIPDPVDGSEATRVFLTLPEERSQVDFREFTAQRTVAAIESLASHAGTLLREDAQVLAPYGHSFELQGNSDAHLALGLLLEGKVDGLVSPVSYHDRGLGGVGGFMGPVDSAKFRGKQWYIIDDTRTGMRFESGAGAATRVAGIHSEDVYNVHKRNFGAALAHRLGLIWSDPAGKGALMDEATWVGFKAMQRAYRELSNAPKTGPLPTQPMAGPTLCVVVDERSRLFQRCDAALNRRLLIDARDCALQTGVPTQFCLLEDVLEDRAPPAPAYLFLNAFCMSGPDRATLHTRLANEKATAIWLYAPGYIDDAPASGTFCSAKNISETTGVQVKAFEEDAQSGSVWIVDATLIEKGDIFGETAEWAPLFYIDDDDPNTTLLANYRETEKPSVAIKSIEAGWDSAFIAEPTLVPAVLRQILLIVGQHVYLRRSERSGEGAEDVAHFGPGLVAIHSRGEGERILDIESACDIQDVLDAATGWSGKETLSLPLRLGETLLLQLTPTGPSDGPDAEQGD